MGEGLARGSRACRPSCAPRKRASSGSPCSSSRTRTARSRVVGADLVYLRGLGIRNVYVYRSNDFTAEEWRPVTRQPNGMRMFAQTNRVGFAARAGFAGFYTYDILLYDGAKFGRLCDQARGARDSLRAVGRPRLLSRAGDR